MDGDWDWDWGQKENVKHWEEIVYGWGPWAKWKAFL